MFRSVSLTRLAPWLLGASLCLGCGAESAQAARPTQPLAPPRPSAAPVPRAPVAAATGSNEPVVDGAVALDVRRDLDRGGGIPAQKIHSSVERGVVTLTGEVETGAQALRAVQLAETTRGVRAVVNRLAVDGATRTPAAILADIGSELQQELAGDASVVEVQLKGGHVALQGNVPSLVDKQRAERATWSVYGVTAVNNQLVVVPKVARNDAQIAAEVARALSGDTYLYGQPVQVTVNAGVVSLAGTVDTAFAKRRVHQHASVAGARAIDDEALLVVPDAHSTHTAQRLTIPTAEQCEAAILDSYRLDPRVPQSGIQVQARAAEVTLSGVVSTLPEKLAAGEDAVNAAGVWLVDNRLQVRPGAPYTDAKLKAAVEERLREHPYTGSAAGALRVDVTQGAVILSGQVGSAFQGHEAARVASFVPGVVSVKDDTRPAPSTANQRNDADILADLQGELRSDPRVDAAKLGVQVHDGVATVSGTVANWEARNAILEDVYDVLPVAFDDHVRLRPHAQLIYER
ncbi:MAG: BON domain-containing protein [Polyangiaceae bacterium]